MSTKLSLAVVIAALALGGASSARADIDNIVLVHGALVDGSGWRAVHDILVADGYTVSVAQLPLTSLDADAAAVQRILKRQDGPVVLVGHSYGGVVISVAGNDPRVEALVYVAAFQPDTGESMAEIGAAMPDLMVPGTLIPSEEGFVTMDPARVHETLGADLPTDVTDFMAVAQSPLSAGNVVAEMEKAAWRETPIWAVVAAQDRTVNPGLQRFMYERSGATVTEVKSGHMVIMSQPQAVADVIVAAAQAVE